MLCLLGLAPERRLSVVGGTGRRLAYRFRMAPDARPQRTRRAGLCRLRWHLHCRLAALAMVGGGALALLAAGIILFAPRG